MQYHPWTDRRQFLDMSSDDVRVCFLDWIEQYPGGTVPVYIYEQYSEDNGARRRGGADPSAKQKKALGLTESTDKRDEADDELDPWDDWDDWAWRARDTEDEQAGGDDEKNDEVHVF